MYSEIDIGPLSLDSWYLATFTGIVLALGLLVWRARRYHISPGFVLSLVALLVAAGFLGAKVFHAIFHWQHVIETPSKFLRGGGGMGAFGALLFSIPLGIWFTRYRKLRVWNVADMVAPAIPLVAGFVRLGCFLAGCCFGHPTHGPLWVMFPSDSPAGETFSGLPLLPTQLIQAAAAFLILVVALPVERKNNFEGRNFCTVLVLFGLQRFVIDFFRYYESEQLLASVAGYSIPVTQALAAVLMIGALALAGYLRKTASQNESHTV